MLYEHCLLLLVFNALHFLNKVYTTVKAAVLEAFELVPEAYYQVPDLGEVWKADMLNIEGIGSSFKAALCCPES